MKNKQCDSATMWWALDSGMIWDDCWVKLSNVSETWHDGLETPQFPIIYWVT